MRALIVDDSRAMRAVIGKMVGDLGVETTFAGNGREALAQLEATGRPGAVVAIEWAERWPDPPASAWEVRLAHAGDDQRRIAVRRVPR